MYWCFKVYDYGCTVNNDQEYGIKLQHLSVEPIQTDYTKVVYLVPFQCDLMKSISSHAHNDIAKGFQREYYIYFVPRCEIQCERVSISSKENYWLQLKLLMCKYILSTWTLQRIFITVQILEEEKVYHLMTIGNTHYT
ncbi:hypothetical protein REPUB_Repub13aG0047300 [Reevesia pubescens]